MLTPIATSKSTVLGLRLDHDRRAWVEAAAAQAGVTVRGFFESLIDRARLEASGGSAAIDAPHDAPGFVANGGLAPGDVGTVAPADERGTRPAHGPGTGGPHRQQSRPLPEVPRVVLLPGQVLEATTSATATLIESGGRCLRDAWRVFFVTLLQSGANDSDE